MEEVSGRERREEDRTHFDGLSSARALVGSRGVAGDKNVSARVGVEERVNERCVSDEDDPIVEDLVNLGESKDAPDRRILDSLRVERVSKSWSKEGGRRTRKRSWHSSVKPAKSSSISSEGRSSAQGPVLSPSLT